MVAASFLLGLALRGWSVARASLPSIDRWVLRIALPALVVSRMSRVALGSSVIVPVVVAWTAVGLAFLLVSACARIVGWGRPVTGALLILCALGNTSFLGIGVVGGVLGDAGVGSAVAYDHHGSFLSLSV